jgi:CRP/FNR family transcriptional regulator, cyclic AMP receptor protein
MLRFSGLGRTYADGETICRQGDRAESMYVVQEGCVAVFREEDAVETPIARLGPGEIVGEMALFDRETRSATVRAAGTARVLTLDKRAFLRQIHDDPTLAWRILERMSLTIRRLTSEVARLRGGAT